MQKLGWKILMHRLYSLRHSSFQLALCFDVCGTYLRELNGFQATCKKKHRSSSPMALWLYPKNVENNGEYLVWITINTIDNDMNRIWVSLKKRHEFFLGPILNPDLLGEKKILPKFLFTIKTKNILSTKITLAIKNDC